MPMGADQYRDLVAREMKRFGRGPTYSTDSARDAAVRAANIKAGFGNSTALHKLPQNAVGGAVRPADRGGPGKKAGGAHKPDRKARTASVNQNANVRSPSAAGEFLANPTTPTSLGTFLPNMTTPTSAPGFYNPDMDVRSPSAAGTFLPNPTTPTSLGGPMTSMITGRPDIPLSSANPWSQMNHPHVPTGGVRIGGLGVDTSGMPGAGLSSPGMPPVATGGWPTPGARGSGGIGMPRGPIVGGPVDVTGGAPGRPLIDWLGG